MVCVPQKNESEREYEKSFRLVRMQSTFDEDLVSHLYFRRAR